MREDKEKLKNEWGERERERKRRKIIVYGA